MDDVDLVVELEVVDAGRSTRGDENTDRHLGAHPARETRIAGVGDDRERRDDGEAPLTGLRGCVA